MPERMKFSFQIFSSLSGDMNSNSKWNVSDCNETPKTVAKTQIFTDAEIN